MSKSIYGKQMYEPTWSSTKIDYEEQYKQALRHSQLARPTVKLDMSVDGLNARLIELESRMNNLYTKLDETNKMNEYLQEMINEMEKN